MGEFFAGLDADIGDAPDVATRLERGLVAGRRRLEEHTVLQQALRAEADQIVPPLYSVMPVVLTALRADLVERFARERLRPGVEVGEAADLLARMTLSYIGTPRELGHGRPGGGAPPREGPAPGRGAGPRRLTAGGPPDPWTLRRIRAYCLVMADEAVAVIDGWATGYRDADELERRLVAAAAMHRPLGRPQDLARRHRPRGRRRPGHRLPSLPRR